MRPDESVISQIVEGVRSVVAPDKIILFGSAATGEMTPDSDLDLLIVEPDTSDQRNEYVRIVKALRGIRYPIDILFISTSWFEQSKDVIGGIAYPAHQHGRVIYEAAATSKRMAESIVKPLGDDPRVKLARDWGRKADQDLRAAQILIGQEYPLLFPVCFHAQQAAEKYLKGLLTYRQIEFPKTHEIEKLLHLLETNHRELAPKLHDVIVLTAYGVEPRYPGDMPEPLHDEAIRAVDLACQVRDTVLPLLESESNSSSEPPT